VTRGRRHTALTSKITPYDNRWPARFLTEKERVAKSFGAELVDIDHVGSTAVPGLATKPEIDLLVEVAEHRNEATRDASMRALGYVRGRIFQQGTISIVAMPTGYERTRSMYMSVVTGRLSECAGFAIS
jgi:GrpB-like predicted nucleotidyltransferase (UPF0157 family)